LDYTIISIRKVTFGIGKFETIGVCGAEVEVSVCGIVGIDVGVIFCVDYFKKFEFASRITFLVGSFEVKLCDD
jgi:hypothetical protein